MRSIAPATQKHRQNDIDDDEAANPDRIDWKRIPFIEMPEVPARECDRAEEAKRIRSPMRGDAWRRDEPNDVDAKSPEQSERQS